MYRRYLDHRLARLHTPFIVPALTTIATLPAERPLHHPTLWQKHETLGVLKTLDHLNRLLDLLLLHPMIQTVVAIFLVTSDQFQPFGVIGWEPTQHPGSRRAVVQRRRRDRDRQQQTQAVHHDMSLPPRNLLVAIVAPHAANFASLDALAVDRGGSGGWISPGSNPNLSDQCILDLVPSFVVPPADQRVVDGALGREIVRKHVPLASGSVDGEDGVEDFPHVHPAGCPTR